MVKRCCWGTCNSDTRYPDRVSGLSFIPFPKPRVDKEKCQRWIRLCGRPHHQFNVDILGDHKKAKHVYVCTKHFVDGKPSDRYPDPLPALHHDTLRPARSHPKDRQCPPSKLPKLEVEDELASARSDLDGEDVPVQLTTDATADEPDQLLLEQLEDEDQLQMLTLASENKEMKEGMAKLLIENEELRRKIAGEKIKEQPTIVKSKFSCSNLPHSQYPYYTGFLYQTFILIFQFLVPVKQPFQFSKSLKCVLEMSLDDQMLLVFMKLRQDFDFKHLANLFLISCQDCSTIFSNWINYMYYRFGSISIWPHRDVLIGNMTSKYLTDFPNTLVIIDGTELKIQRPSSLVRQSQLYSDYKSCTTLKGLIGVDPRGSIIFISMLFNGAISDKEITEKSGFLSHLSHLIDCGKLKRGDGIMTDKGFNIAKEIESLGLCLNIPPFAPCEGQMNIGDVSETVKIAKHRVVVENAIGRVKKFKIVSNKIDLSLFASVNQIWFVCCYLTNFMPMLIQDKK